MKTADERGITFIPLNEHFKLKGELNPRYSWDGIHINADGYRLWFEQIKGYLVNSLKP